MQETQVMQVWSLGWEDAPGVGNGTPLQYSFLENFMDGGGMVAIHGATKSWTWLTKHTGTVNVQWKTAVS